VAQEVKRIICRPIGVPTTNGQISSLACSPVPADQRSSIADAPLFYGVHQATESRADRIDRLHLALPSVKSAVFIAVAEIDSHPYDQPCDRNKWHPRSSKLPFQIRPGFPKNDTLKQTIVKASNVPIETIELENVDRKDACKNSRAQARQQGKASQVSEI
jgi:hypothetical protein